MKKSTIKNLIASTLLFLSGAAAYSQTGLECVVVEKYYVSDANDAAGSVGTLPAGSTTYRVYADMLPGYKFQALYGITGHNMNIQTTTLFFNNEDRGATSPTYTKAQAAGNTVMLDSWFSVGGACSTQLGVMKSEDNGVATVVNADGVLQSTNSLAGIPLTIQDGMLPGTPVSVTFVGLSAAQLDVFDATSNVGSSFSTSNGSVAALGGSTGPTTSNKVLVGQFTTDGVFSFELNIQIGTPTGGVENYVAQSPTGAEIMLPCLTYSSSITTEVSDPTPLSPSASVFPNPASDVIKMEITAPEKSESNNYKLYDITGSVVAQKSLGELSGTSLETNDISSLSAGLYFMELTIDGTRITKKIIKK